MEMAAIILLLVGVLAMLAYGRGKDAVKKEVLASEVEANEDRKTIRNMSDHELDDELSEHWE